MAAAPEQQLALFKQGAVDLVSEPDLLARLRLGRPLIVKLGLDPTAPDLHLGHTVVLKKLRQFQDLGHVAHLILGDFTGRIGDPTGRNATRPPLSDEEIRKNAETYEAQAFRVLDRARTVLHFNGTWLGKLSSVEVIQLAAKYTVARLLERDDFKKRFQGGVAISVHELLYPLMQAYDSVAIRADVELGGTDQLFNLLVGRDIMRDYALAPQIVLTTPLLEGTDARWVDGKLAGDKMSKSLGNYVGITEPPNEIFGKLMSISDPLMWRYFELLSERSAPERQELQAGHPMEAKKALAREIVARFHSEEAAQGAQAAFERTARGEDAREAHFVGVPQAASPRKTIDLLTRISLAADRSQFGEGSKEWRVIQQLEDASKARRLIEQGAVQIGGQTVRDPEKPISAQSPWVVTLGGWTHLRVEERLPREEVEKLRRALENPTYRSGALRLLAKWQSEENLKKDAETERLLKEVVQENRVDIEQLFRALPDQIEGYWISPGGEISPQKPGYLPSSGILPRNDGAAFLALAWVDDCWAPLSEAAVHTWVYTIGLLEKDDWSGVVEGATWRFVEASGWPAYRVCTGFDDPLPRKKVAQLYGPEAAKRARPDRRIIQLRFDPKRT